MRALRQTGLFAVTLLLASSAAATDYAGAFLELGMGTRGPGLGGACVAAAADAEAVFWNPAGLVSAPGVRTSVAIVPLSLDRVHNSAAVAVNMRGDMAFGFGWLHAGVDGIQGRTGSGVPTGSIEDGENAFLVSVSRGLGKGLSVGLTLKVLNQRLDVPGWNRAEATGHGVDAGVLYQVSDQLHLGAAIRNLDASLEWTVERGSSQASSTTDTLQQAAVVGLAYRPLTALMVSLDVVQAADAYANVGAEWVVSDLLTLRAGIQHVEGDASAPEQLSAGMSLRPMRTDALRFHYAYITDQLDAGDRSVFGLSMAF